MITAGIIRNGANYLSHHLRKNDYWAEGEKAVLGEWIGEGATALGLSGNITDEPFEALRTNRHGLQRWKDSGRDKLRVNAACYEFTTLPQKAKAAFRHGSYQAAEEVSVFGEQRRSGRILIQGQAARRVFCAVFGAARVVFAA
jgi:hypothetical protein